jgi:phosphatidylglycerol:prolipoprotein diacylglycerol transferase
MFVDLPWGGTATVQPYGLLVWLGLTVGLVIALLFARRFDRSPARTLELATFLVAFSFPASYLLNGLLYQTEDFIEILREPSRFREFQIGLSSFGGIVGSVIGGLVWRYWRKDSLLRVGESFAFAGPFGWAIGRIGCFVTHDHPGRATDFFLAVADFQTGTAPYVPRHDLGFYDMLVFIGIATTFAVLVRKPRPTGFYVALLPILYTPFRFALDFLRAPASDGGDVRYAGLTPGQYGAIVLFFVGVVLMRRLRSGSTAPRAPTRS